MLNKYKITSINLQEQFFPARGQFKLKALSRRHRRLRMQSKLNKLYFLNNFGSWVIIFIHSVTETKKNFLFLLYFFNEFLNILFRSDSLKHSNDSFVCSSVFGAIESSSRHSNCCININS